VVVWGNCLSHSKWCRGRGFIPDSSIWNVTSLSNKPACLVLVDSLDILNKCWILCHVKYATIYYYWRYFCLLLFMVMVNLSLLKSCSHIDGVEVEVCSLLTPAWDGGDWSYSRSRCFASQLKRFRCWNITEAASVQKYSWCCERQNNSLLYNNCHYYDY
jgi:hypothetical protein